jgi:hypothetical protein
MGASPGAWLLQEFVLRAGRDWPGSPLPPRRRRMVPKRCFSNAARVVAASRGGLDYCEGFVMSRNVGLAVHHAWAVDRQTGAVVDPTLAEPGRAAYVGVAIGPSERATWLVEGSSSVLAGPIALNLDYLLFREPSLADLPEIAAVRS